MLEVLAAGALGVAGHIKSKKFVHRRLRFTKIVEKPGLGLMTGVGTAVAIGALAPILPFVGAATTITVGIGTGIGVGTGVTLGAHAAKRGPPPDDDDF